MFEALKHWWIRRKLDMRRIDADRYRLVIARTREQYQQAFRLVQVGYVFEGIEPPGPRALRITEHHVLRREASVVLAYEGEHLVGTMTLTLDSPAGLPLDRDYPDEVALLRAGGDRLAELGSFAIVRRCWSTGVAQLLGVAAVQLGIRQGAERFVIGVHPRAACVYQALWGFSRFGAIRPHNHLVAPVAGLTVTRRELARHAARHHAAPFPWSGGTLTEHIIAGAPLPFFEVPPQVDQGRDRFARWKMESGVFELLFRSDSNRLDTISSDVKRCIDTSRRRRLAG